MICDDVICCNNIYYKKKHLIWINRDQKGSNLQNRKWKRLERRHRSGSDGSMSSGIDQYWSVLISIDCCLCLCRWSFWRNSPHLCCSSFLPLLHLFFLFGRRILPHLFSLFSSPFLFIPPLHVFHPSVLLFTPVKTRLTSCCQTVSVRSLNALFSCGWRRRFEREDSLKHEGIYSIASKKITLFTWICSFR